MKRIYEQINANGEYRWSYTQTFEGYEFTGLFSFIENDEHEVIGCGEILTFSKPYQPNYFTD